MEEVQEKHDETMKDVQDILEESLDSVVESIKEVEENLDEEEQQEQQEENKPETFWQKFKNIPPFVHLGISLGLVSVAVGVYLLKNKN